MEHLIIKYFFIILTSIHCYTRLLSLKKLKYSSSKLVLFSYTLVCSLLLYVVRCFVPYLSIYILIITLFFVLKYIYKTDSLLTISTILYSLGIAYGSYFLFTIIITFMINILLRIPTSNIYILQILVSLTQLISCILLFKIKRFKDGMPFLKKEYHITTGIISSIIILTLTMLISNNNGELALIVPFICILFFAIFIYVFWKNHLRQVYDKNQADKREDYLNHEIEQLRKEKEILSKLVHRDNKLIPALEMTVRDYVNNYGDTPNSQNIIEQLDNLTSERKGIIKNSSYKNICRTGFVGIDSMINYMYTKAQDENIEFNFILVGDLSEHIYSTISISDFDSILGDLIENAIIATKFNNGKHVLVIISTSPLSIEVYDSGAPFDIKVLANLGLKRITTHKEFGSGIGLTSIYEFGYKYNYSLTINEYKIDDPKYTKAVSIEFGNVREYCFITERSYKELKPLLRREDITIKMPAKS